MKILITGSNGMLGQDLCPILEDAEYEIFEGTRENFDITDFELVKKVLKTENPDVAIHCAAYTNVDKAEEEQEKAFLVNSKATENLAKICGENDILLVYISTDYVFDGEKKEAYLPEDKTNPINVYGKSKLKGEIAVQKYCKRYYIVRTSWLFGHYGKNFVETMLSLAEKPELKVVNDQLGCPTWTVDLSEAIADLLEEQPEYGIYHICGSSKTSWYDFAKEIFSQHGLKVNLKPCSTEEFSRPAKRPTNSVLENNGVCRNWKLALKEYLELRIEE